MSVKIIAIAGGSCSGKTTFSRRAREKLGEDNCSVLFQDNYYIDQSQHFDEDGGAVNFDHPSSLDFDLMEFHLSQIKQGKAVEVPLYDFSTHSRKEQVVIFEPNSIVLVDGILILSQPKLLPHFDAAVYIECDPETRFKRRLSRDVKERGRTPEGVETQFYTQVEPMHQEFVRPSKESASIVLSQQEYLDHADHHIKILKDKFLVK